MQLLGVKISAIPKKDFLRIVQTYLEDGRSHHLVTTNPEYIVTAQSNEMFREVINKSDISVADGIGVLIGAEYLQRGVHKKGLSAWIEIFKIYFQVAKAGSVKTDTGVVERMSGVDILWLLVQQDWLKGRKIYFLGGTENVAGVAVRRLQQVNPAVIFRSSNGVSNIRQYSEEENRAIIQDISAFAPDLLCVAYGHPWQDLWINEFRDELNFKVAMGVGGSFDYIANRVPRAPGWMRSAGLEWLYRLIKQPRRFKRIVNATYTFCKMVIENPK